MSYAGSQSQSNSTRKLVTAPTQQPRIWTLRTAKRQHGAAVALSINVCDTKRACLPSNRALKSKGALSGGGIHQHAAGGVIGAPHACDGRVLFRTVQTPVERPRVKSIRLAGYCLRRREFRVGFRFCSFFLAFHSWSRWPRMACCLNFAFLLFNGHTIWVVRL